MIGLDGNKVSEFVPLGEILTTGALTKVAALNAFERGLKLEAGPLMPKHAGIGEKSLRGGATHKRPAKVRKGTKVCKICGKPGHMQKTCPDHQSKTPEEALAMMGDRPITAAKLAQVKSMLEDEVSSSNIEAETGVSRERIEKMRSDLGL